MTLWSPCWGLGQTESRAPPTPWSSPHIYPNYSKLTRAGLAGVDIADATPQTFGEEPLQDHGGQPRSAAMSSHVRIVPTNNHFPFLIIFISFHSNNPFCCLSPPQKKRYFIQPKTQTSATSLHLNPGLPRLSPSPTSLPFEVSNRVGPLDLLVQVRNAKQPLTPLTPISKKDNQRVRFVMYELYL